MNYIPGWLIKIVFVGSGIALCLMGILILSRIRELHLIMNSRLDQLLEATKLAATAQGHQDERDSQKMGK